jgi:hypothetical protein
MPSLGQAHRASRHCMSPKAPRETVLRCGAVVLDAPATLPAQSRCVATHKKTCEAKNRCPPATSIPCNGNKRWVTRARRVPASFAMAASPTMPSAHLECWANPRPIGAPPWTASRTPYARRHCARQHDINGCRPGDRPQGDDGSSMDDFDMRQYAGLETRGLLAEAGI